jgi:hypothetical protein
MRSGTKNRKVVRAGPGPTRRTTHTVCGFYGYVTFVGFTCQMGRAPAGVSMRRGLSYWALCDRRMIEWSWRGVTS